MSSAIQRLPALDSLELEALFAQVPLATLESSQAVIYATDPDFRLLYVNPAWDQFAVENDAPHLVRRCLGRISVLDASGPLRRFYVNLFEQATSTGKPVEHRFLCPSPTHHREFQMRVLPLRGGGILASIALQVQQMHDTPSSVYVDDERIITMCAHCRRTKQLSSDRWDWIPEYVASPPEQTSHGLCQVCLEFHYLSLKRG